MVAQRRARVIEVERAALLQDRHDLVDEVFQAIVVDIGRHAEAVGGFCLEPALHVIGDDGPGWARRAGSGTVACHALPPAPAGPLRRRLGSTPGTRQEPVGRDERDS